MNSLFILFSLIIFSFDFALAESNEIYSYCIPTEKIDFNPFREIIDGKDLAYLMLLKSYISTDESEGGILGKYEFSPDGKSFSAQLSKDLKWSDGRSVTAREAAYGIAKALPFRTLGKRVKIAGAEKINQLGWSKQSYENIKLIDERTFKINFESEIENLTGVLREALSTNSRHNRFWPVRLEKDEAQASAEVLFKFPFTKINGLPGIEFEGKKITFSNLKNCSKSNFSIFPEVFQSLDGLTKMKSPSASAVIALPNTSRLNLEERKTLIAWLRSSFTELPKVYGVQEVDAFFLSGESGFDKSVKWPTSSSVTKLKRRKLVIGVEIPIYKKFIEDAAKKYSLKVQLISSPSDRSDVDVYVIASGLIEGRYVFLQDALKWKHINDFLVHAKKTKRSLEIIAEMSASTLPPDLMTLSNFEKNALFEFSMAPIARRYPTAFSEANLGLCLAWTQRGELSFFSKGKCLEP